MVKIKFLNYDEIKNIPTFTLDTLVTLKNRIAKDVKTLPRLLYIYNEPNSISELNPDGMYDVENLWFAIIQHSQESVDFLQLYNSRPMWFTPSTINYLFKFWVLANKTLRNDPQKIFILILSSLF